MIHWIKRQIPKSFKRTFKRILQNLWQSIAYGIVCSRDKEIHKIEHIVFVCTGNICRSAFAEHALRVMLNDSNVIIESCGINVYKETCSPFNAIQAALMFNVDLSFHYSKNIAQCDLFNADLIVPMDYGHYKYLKSNYPIYKNKIKLLRDLIRSQNNFFINISDPFGMNINEFNNCFMTIVDSLNFIVEFKKNKY